MTEKLRDVIKERLAEKKRLILAIDGMAAAGKSTLAKKLAEEFGGETVCMDDFFLPLELRTAERLAEPGGNVHYERFAFEVAKRLRKGEAFDYGVFDCSVMAVTGEKHIENTGFVIVEGAYSLRPEFRELYDFKVFMKIPAKTQEERILARSGESKLKVFKEKWIPLEERYFEALDPEKAADMVI